MIICDRCWSLKNEAVRAFETIQFDVEKLKVNLCKECTESVKAFVTQKPKKKKAGRPKKEEINKNAII